MLVFPKTKMAKITRPLKKLKRMKRKTIIDQIVGYLGFCYSSSDYSVQKDM